MGFGIFGKLPQKRDFIAFGIPRAILEPFENWLQSAVAASKNELGRNWQDQYLVAPIWRFWGGKDIFGVDCIGVIMPSVDQVGRFFPLSVIYYDESGNGLVPPVSAENDQWFTDLEERLLHTLDEEDDIEARLLTEGLAAPEEEVENSQRVGKSFDKGRIWREYGMPVSELLANISQSDYRAACEGRSFWWTNGGRSFGSIVYSQQGLPDPYFFTSMITGGVE
jgi:type VI secretion system protein ImpM